MSSWSPSRGRCRPSKVLAAAYDLRVFISVVDKAPGDVVPADGLSFITAQRAGRSSIEALEPLGGDHEAAGVATSTVARRAGFATEEDSGSGEGQSPDPEMK